MGKAEKKAEDNFFGDILQQDTDLESDAKFIKNFSGGVLHTSELKSIQVSSISLSSSQPRKYFDENSLQELTESIRENGVLEPLLVRRINSKNERFELIAGERRLRAAKLAGLPIVPVNIIEADDLKSRKLALIENLQREDLNPIEETEGILQLLSMKLSKPQSEVVALLYRMNNELKNSVNHNVMVSELRQSIEEVFESLGKMKWDSFVSNRLPLLKLPENILDALRKGDIAYTKAKELAKVQDKKVAQALLNEALANKLSLSAIKKRIKEEIFSQGENKKESTPRKPNSSRFRELLELLHKTAEQYDAWDNKEVCDILEEALQKVEKSFK